MIQSSYFCLVMLILGTWPMQGRADETLDCFEQAEIYGDGNGPRYISSNCVDEAQERSLKKQKFDSENGSMSIIGYKNMIVIKRPKVGTEFIAGPATRLQKITSLSYDEVKKEIHVIDAHSNERLVFSIDLTGNIAPSDIRSLGDQAQ